jgi:CRP-like cAMP-binding protein
MKEFFDYLNAIQPMAAECQAALFKVVRTRELRRGQVWLQEGAVCDKITFVVRGMLKLYFEAGSKDLVLSFARENEFMISAQSYFNSEFSKYSIRSVEASSVISIACTDLSQLVEKYPDLQINMIAIAHAQVASLEAHTGLLMLAVRERFRRVAELYPWMVDGSRLTDKLLAAFLGVTPASVSYWRNGRV